MSSGLKYLDLITFIRRAVWPRTQAVVDRTEHLVLSERDTLRVIDLLENPPAPPARLIAAAKAGQILK